MPGLNYRLIVPPTVEPVSLSLAKKQVRVDIPDDNDLISMYIGVAREYCENKTNRAFYTQTLERYLDVFPYGDYRSTIPMDQRDPWEYSAYWNDFSIRLPKPMLLSVNSITYMDATGTEQTLDPSKYYVDVNARPGRIVPVAGSIWPLIQFYIPNSIVVQYMAGSYVTTVTENVAVAQVGANGPYLGTLANQLISITSVKDTNGIALAYTSSIVNDDNGDPTTQTQISLTTAPAGNTAVVTYQAGIIPKPIQMAMLLIIGHLYEHREENTELSLKTLPLGVDRFLRNYTFNVFGNYRSGR